MPWNLKLKVTKVQIWKLESYPKEDCFPANFLNILKLLQHPR